MTNKIHLTFLVIFVSFLFSDSVLGQNKNTEIDSLIDQTATMSDDVKKADLFLKISRLKMSYQLISSLEYAQKAKELAVVLNYTEGVVNSLLQQTRIYTQKGNLDSARIRIDASLLYLEADTNFPQLIAKTNF